MSDLVELIARLVELDSVNPGLDPAGGGEGRVAAFAAEWLARAGLEVEVREVEPGRPNVIGTARGLHDGPALLLAGHTDTVSAGRMAAPFEARVDGDRLHGRGAYDMKGGLAAAMLAAAGARGLGGDVVVAAVCDEELGSAGMLVLAEHVRAGGAVVTEPTDLAVATAHRGFAGFTITTAGVAAHGSMPHLGHDAIADMGPVLVALRELDERLQAGPPHPLLGTPSLHASLIAGGQEFSSYPAACRLDGEVRTVPGMPDVAELLRPVAGAAGELAFGITREPLETPADSPVARIVCRHAGVEPSGMPYWTDAALLASAGVPAVLFGPAGAGAHGDEEWVDLPSAQRVADVLGAVAREFCGG